MRSFLLATHGYFADGIYNSLKIIMGEQNNVSTLCAYVDGKNDLKKEVIKIIQNMKKGEELIVLTDIFGGSVNNEFMNYIGKGKIHLISGLNLPLLIELISRQEEEDIELLIEDVLLGSKKTIQYCNSILKSAEKVEDEDF